MGTPPGDYLIASHCPNNHSATSWRNHQNALMALTPAGDILANINEMEWLDVGGVFYFKLHHAKTGHWVLYAMEPGARFQPHRHEGWGQFFITKGELIYDVGSAPAGPTASNRSLRCIMRRDVRSKPKCCLGRRCSHILHPRWRHRPRHERSDPQGRHRGHCGTRRQPDIKRWSVRRRLRAPSESS